MLIIKTYTCPRFKTTTHSFKVIHNEKVIKFYNNLDDATLNQLKRDYKHSLVEHINVVKKVDLR